MVMMLVHLALPERALEENIRRQNIGDESTQVLGASGDSSFSYVIEVPVKMLDL